MPEKKISITLDGKKIKVEVGQTIWQIAKARGIDIPNFCYHADFKPKANCRVCVVEIEGRKNLATSCSTIAQEGMVIKTDTQRVQKARKMNIELLFAEHIEKCPDCVWRFNCGLLDAASKYKLLITRFKDRKKNRKTYKFANAVEIDGSQCIDCRNCIDACVMQGINFLEIKGKGIHQEVVPSSEPYKHCILCGQCALHCPVSAAQEQVSYKEVEKELKNKDKIVIAQFAPSIRVSIGEDFGLDYGEVVTGQMVTALRELGFEYVFDVNFGADVTTIVEAEELIERITNKGVMPMFTSCCPAWVNFVEFYRPDLIPNLTTSRSPQIHNGGIIKTYWANKMGIDPKRIVVVSIMPCTAKKYEASRSEMKIDNNFPVDYVLTTREFSFMMKKNGIDLAKLKKGEADNPMGDYTGGAAIFGATGGVMESALRTANSILCDAKEGKCVKRVEFKSVRGMDGIKEAVVDVAGNKLRVAIVNGIGNAPKLLERLNDFDYIEVMTCPGGCIGGGGQPIPTNNEIRKKRTEALYNVDKNLKLRVSCDNQNAKDILAWLEKKGHNYNHKVLHTGYNKKKSY